MMNPSSNQEQSKEYPFHFTSFRSAGLEFNLVPLISSTLWNYRLWN